mgnify:CR=1 FL=1
MFSRFIFTLLSFVFVVAPVAVHALDDPTRPSSFRAAKKAETLKLESILHSEVRKVAVINGQVLAEGESIGSKKVVHIGKESVRLANGNQELTLTLKRSSIRQEK